MSRRVTIYDIATFCDVAPSTVSKAMSERRHSREIPLATRIRIRQAAEALGYDGNWARRRAASKRSWIIGLIYAGSAPQITGVYQELAIHLAAAASSYGFRLALIPVGIQPGDWHRVAAEFKLDGCVLIEPLPPGIGAWRASQNIPVVIVNHDPCRHLPRIMADDRWASQLAVAHAIACGYRQIAYISPCDDGHPSVRERRQGFRFAVRKHREQLDAVSIVDSQNPDAMTQCLSSLRGGAVVVYDHRIARLVVQHAQQSGCIIPRDVGLICCDDTAMLDVLAGGVTAIAVPVAEMAWTSVGLLVDIVNGKAAPTGGRIRCQGMLVERGSMPRLRV